jgi:hypothetical protein
MGGAVLMYRPFHPSNAFEYSIVSAYLSLKWSDYAIILFIFLLVFWLGLLTWLIYHGFSSSNRKYRDLNRDLKVNLISLKKSIDDLAESTGRQGFNLERANDIADNLAKDLATHEKNIIFSLRQSLRDQEERSLGFQASYQAKLETSGQASSSAPVQVEASQPIDKQQTLEDLVASLVEEYQTAFFRGDRPALRNMSSDQLNITQSSEGSLMRTSVPPTQLEVVQNGGSYLLVHRYDRHWLVPEFQILTSFTTTQPAKGIFTYHRENISKAELRWPAEVREVGGLWEVVNMGLIAVPS